MRKPFSIPNSRHAIWPTLPIDVYFRKEKKNLPYPLDQKNYRLFSLARHAIWNACKAFNLDTNDAILVPAYHHGSEIEALIQAGLQVIYYEINDDLEPVAEELEKLLRPNVRALYIIHYLGFPQRASFWREWCDSRGLLLMEDAAQAFLTTSEGRPVGSFGHMAVFCLYKTYGVPDGGALISVKPPAAKAKSFQLGFWKTFKRHFNWIAARRSEIGLIHLYLKPIISNFVKLYEHPHKEFDLGNPTAAHSFMLKYLLPRVIDSKTVERRRANYEFFLSHLQDIVPYPFNILPEGACPFAFPVTVSKPQEFLVRLRAKGIIGLLFWLNPHPTLPVSEFPKSRELRENMLALPVHQELTEDNLIQIVKAVKDSLNELNIVYNTERASL